MGSEKIIMEDKKVVINGVTFYYNLLELERELIEYLKNKKWEDETYTVYIDESQGLVVC
jgi:hypothetical protein